MTEDELMAAIRSHELHVKQCQLLRQEPTDEARAKLLEAIEAYGAEQAADAGLLWIKTADLGLLHAKAAVCDATRERLAAYASDDESIDLYALDVRLQKADAALRELESKP